MTEGATISSAPAESQGEVPGAATGTEQGNAQEQHIQEASPETSEGTQPEALAQGMDGEAKKSGRHAFYEKFTSKFAGRQFGDDNEILDAASEHFDEVEGKLTRSAESNKIVMDALEGEPVLAKIIMDVSKGASFAQALALHLNPDELVPIEGDPDYQGWNENRKARAKTLEERRTFEEELTTNSKASVDEIKAFVKENNMSDQEAADFLETVNQSLTDVYKGKITKDFLTKWKLVLSRDQDVQKAHQQGEIKGRNTNIEAVKAEQPKGDNLPKVLSTAAKDKPLEAEKPVNPIAQSIDDFNKRRSVFP
jgi:predicted XRE-type DNA-binding protein